VRILISCDMEGISGIVAWAQVTPGTSEYLRGCQLMVGDVNAAAQAAFQAGAAEVAVSDAHWYARNIWLGDLDERVALNSGSPAPISMLQGIGGPQPYDAVICVGYHARAGTWNGVLSHTWSTAVAGVWLNNRPVGEIGINAAVAGHFGTPIVALTGDAAACDEARELLGPALETATVKVGLGHTAASCLPLVESRAQIATAVRSALGRLAQATAPQPYVVDRPVQLAVEYLRPNLADRSSWVPGARRVTGTRLEYEAPDVLAALRAFRSMTALATE
jgi:D-amino peptidase